MIAALLRLMQFKTFKGRLGPEDRLAVEIAVMLRVATLEGRLKATWTHVANEVGGRGKLAAIQTAKAKALGLIGGTPDYVFAWPEGSGWIELKAADGSLSPNQKDFREWCQGLGVRHAVVRSVDEFEGVIISWGILT